ncbi:MAG: discoidin domain-containing protein [Chloroflexi bacterium]|nr:discoidin domain-containing protein [Chloroflexota bacterium]
MTRVGEHGNIVSMAIPLNPSRFPAYIYGLHDLGGQNLMLEAQRPGWLLDSVDLRSQVSTDYSSLAEAGFGLIIRLNHGYDPVGTIPPSDQYDAFAAKCAAYVADSPGPRIWIIGNEMNLGVERPQFRDGTREVITPDKYAQCFLKCRQAIRGLEGHSDDWVIPGAVGPYNNETVYPGNVRGDWVQYLVDLLNLLGNNTDGIALHCHTHDYNPNQITGDRLMDPPFNDRRYDFRTFRDFLEALPEPFRNLPVFITEANPYMGWRDSNLAWIQTAYDEINSWNADPSNQPIQALIPYRWQTLEDHPEWGMQDKPALVSDFRIALRSSYRVRWPDPRRKPAKPTPPPDLRAQWLITVNIPNRIMVANSVVVGHVAVKNIGGAIWKASGPNPVKLGYRWFDAEGKEVFLPQAESVPLLKDVRPAESVTFERVELRAPSVSGPFTLRWDMMVDGIVWFSARQSPTQDIEVDITAPATRPLPPPDAEPSATFAFVPTAAAGLDTWAALFLGHDTPISMVAGQATSVNLRIKNAGASTWSRDGGNPVHAGYKWFTSSGRPQLDVEDRRTALPMDIAPDQEAVFGAILAAPKTAGDYYLRWDLVSEGMTWFADTGNPPLVIPVHVTSLPSDVDLWRAEASLNPSEVVFALDGNPNTFWDSHTPQAPGQWFRLNFSSPRLVDGFQFLSPGRGFPRGYLLNVSQDGKTWIELIRHEADNERDVMAVFAPQLVQYAQIDLVAGPDSEMSWMISEVLFHPAVHWAANASHNTKTAALVIDDRPDTEWTSGVAQQVGMWFQIDLGREEAVSGLALVGSPEEAPANFRITVWNARLSKWQVVHEQEGNVEPVQASFDTVRTQFLNIQLLDASPQPWSIQNVLVSRDLNHWLGPKT